MTAIRDSVARQGFATSLAAVAAAAALMMLPALWNGYPLFYYDSVDYIRLPFTWELPLFRTMPYAVMGLVGKLAGTLWAIPLLQSLLVAYLMHEALAVFTRMPLGMALVPVATVVAALTSLPWYSGQIMADVFAGLVVLGIAMLAFGADRLGRGRSLLVAAVVAFGICVHTTHVAIAAGLVLSLLTLRVLLRKRPHRPVQVLLPILALATGVTLILSIHWVTVGRPFIAQPSNKLMLGRLVQDGMAKRLLDDVCPTGKMTLKLCAYRNHPSLQGSANAFLWAPSPFGDLGGWQSAELDAEAAAIIHETLHRYPLQHLIAALKLTAEQFFMLETGDGLIDMREHAQYAVAQYYPDELISFLKAHQHAPRLKARQAAKRFAAGIDFHGMNALHVPIVLVSIAAVLVLMGRWRRRGEWRLWGFSVVVLLALLGNAVVCGALSNPNHRYQSRLAWLPILVVAIAAARRVEERVTGPTVERIRA